MTVHGGAVTLGRSSCLLGLGLGLALVAASCQGEARPGTPGPRPSVTTETATGDPEPVPVTVAFLETLDGDEAARRAATAFQAAALAFSNASFVGDLPVSVELVAFDTGEDLAASPDVVSEVLADPSVVAVIGAPGLEAQAAIGDALDAAGMPWISLSGIGSALGDRGWDGWRRMIADQRTQGRVLGDALARSAEAGACLLGDGATASRGLLSGVVAALDGDIVLRATVPEGQAGVSDVARAVERSGCGVVVWGGEGVVAAAVRRQLVGEGLRRVRFAGGDRMRDEVYVEAAGPAAEGTLATCPCLDVSTSTELAAQRFIQDYQAEFGLPPGPYAVEAWDAARLLVAAFRGGAITRREVLAAVATTRSYEGLGGAYRFDRTGELAAAEERVTLSEVAGGRWLLAPVAP